MQEWLISLEQMIDLSFWIHFVERVKDYGPLAPILLALLESIIPALPLLVIISFNVGVYGPVFGFMFSWIGTTLGSMLMFLFYRHFVKRFLHQWIMRKQKLANIHEWISHHRILTLFCLSALPFTPSSLINLAYGLSDFKESSFLITIFFSKAIMVLAMTMFGHSIVSVSEQPWFLIASAFMLSALYYVSKHFSRRYLHSN